MPKDLLGQFAKNAEKEIGERESTTKKEPVKTVGIRASDYDQLRLYAFNNHLKMVDVLHKVIQTGIGNLEN